MVPRSERAALLAGSQVISFDAFESYVLSKQGSLPEGLQSDAVVKFVSRYVIKSAALAQVDLHKARANLAGAQVDANQISEVENYEVPEFTYGDLKTFTRTVLGYGLRPGLATPAAIAARVARGTPTATDFLAEYLSTYYGGKFYDRFGALITKPSLSLTITDAEVAAAVSVLLEYFVDTIDPTPVMGSTATPTSGTTVYYPGNNKNEPTALVAGITTYQSLPATAGSKCEWAQDSAPTLGYLANAAGDQAAAVTGTVSGGFGGIEIGLGFLGKFSLGDNKMLETVLSSAASRAAMRATLASAYWAVESAQTGTVVASKLNQAPVQYSNGITR